MNHQNNVVDVLAELSQLTDSAIDSHLTNKYSNRPELISAVKKILKLNLELSSYPVSDVLANAAEQAIKPFNPINFIGEIMGDWKIIEVISETKKSAIFKAIPANEKYSHIAAIKIVQPAFKVISGEQHINMQAHYMSKLKHRNMVEVKSAGQTPQEGINYVVMEYLPGGNIVDYCEQNNLSLVERLDLFLQTCSGVSYMHQNTVIHSDLKPSNVLLDTFGTPKIIDLDLSHTTDKKFHENHNYDLISGHTSLYAAPEQLSDKGATSLSDIYALGELLAEICIGIRKDLMEDSPHNILKEKFNKFGRLVELESIIEKARAMTPSKRYPSVSALMEDIQKLKDGKSIVSSYKANILYKSRFAAKRYFSFILVAAVAFTLVAGTVLQIINERNEARESLHLLLSSSDPRKLESRETFNKRANLAIQKSSFIASDHYDELIGWGDAYYGKGDAHRAIDFFRKARGLYDDKSSTRRINAATKLALAYYSIADLSSALAEIRPYYEEIFSDKLKSAELATMLLAYYEITERLSFNYAEDGKELVRPLSEVINTIDLEAINNTKERKKLKIDLLAKAAINDYYQLDNDLVSVVSYVSDRQMSEVVIPQLNNIKSKLEEAINIIKSENVVTHIEPRIYLWLGTIESELQNFTAAQTYLDLGLEKTINIFGDNHVRVVEAHRRYFQSMRYRYPSKAYQHAIEALKIAQSPSNSGIGTRFHAYYIPIIAAINNGRPDLAERHLSELFEKHDSERRAGSITDLDQMITADSAYMFFTSRYYPTKHLKRLQNMAAEVEKAYSDLELTDASPIIYNALDSAYLDRTKANQLLENFKKAHLASFDFPHQEATSSLLVAEICSYIQGCEYQDLLNIVHRNFQWSQVDNKVSTEKLDHSIRLARLYNNTNQYVKAENLLLSVENILQSRKNRHSIYYVSWYFEKHRASLGQSKVELANLEKTTYMTTKEEMSLMAPSMTPYLDLVSSTNAL